MNELLDDALQMASAQLRENTSVERLYVDVPPVHCAPQELKQVFLNLIVNAGQAVGSGGSIRVSTSRVGSDVDVCIEDDGPGIPPEIIDRIFDPFFTTKPVGDGTGLGLGIAYRIVRNHGGDIRVDSEPSSGTRFHVTLPASEGDDDAS
jgi:signal transduction histidine kinase